MSDTSRAAVQNIEAVRHRWEALNNDFFIFIRDPAVIRSKSDKVISVAGQGMYGDKMCIA